MEADQPHYLKGQFLIAMPTLADPNFFQTVTCMSEHSAGGAVGIVINRTHSVLCCGDILKELKVAHIEEVKSLPVHIGGPVHMGEIFILHGPPLQWEGSLQITPTLAMSNTMDILKAIAMGRGPSAFIIALGCAGWGPGQLEAEIRENAWLTGPVFEDLIFKIPTVSRWEEALRKNGIDPHLLSGQAGHA